MLCMSSAAIYFLAVIRYLRYNHYANIQGLDGAIWDLKFSEYVEYLACVPSEYLKSSALPSWAHDLCTFSGDLVGKTW